MSTFTNRLLVCACMAISLSLFSGCGPKPVEPYNQQKTTPKNNALYDSDNGAATDDAAAAAGTGDYSSSALDNLPSAPGTGAAADIQNSPNASPSVEPLTAGSGPSDKAAGFGADQSDAYKRKNGRSSPEMKSIYYDFDQSSVRPDQVAKMEANAHYLKKPQGRKVVVQGNCDERGTSEYNLALGERRAAAAKKYLVNLGVEAGRVRTISFGEERPLFLGSQESDYEMNRRSDFVLE